MQTEDGTADEIVYAHGYGDLEDQYSWNKNTVGGYRTDLWEYMSFEYKPGHPKVVHIGKGLLARRVVLDHRYRNVIVAMCEMCLESELPCDQCYKRLCADYVDCAWAGRLDFPDRYTPEKVLKLERDWLKKYRKETWTMDEFTKTILKNLIKKFAADRFHPIPPFLHGSSLSEPGDLKLVECSMITEISKTYDKVSDEKLRCYKYRSRKEEHVVNIRYNFYIPCGEQFVIQIFGSPPESLTDANVQYIFFLHSQLESARELACRRFPGYSLTGFVDCLNYVGFLEFAKEDFVKEWDKMYTVIKGCKNNGSICDGVLEDRTLRLNQLTCLERYLLFSNKHHIYNSFFYRHNLGIYVNGAWKVVGNIKNKLL